ncbi:HlyU family transcriptional regulator [Psychromonas aquimarina]|uniref:HlyU family transcriptional regulator n=1 Tax=Psychromonas aquimarina TaxID=444919 RepID=UPI0003F4E64F|nr:HlyU family transcriptional regulator [Psychromonas aquimarina]
MGFLKKITGLFNSSESETGAAAFPSEEYKGFIITPQPKNESGRFYLAALIEKPAAQGQVPKQHYLIRSDTYASAEQAAEFSLSKSRVFIDQVGDDMFTK